MTPTTRLTTALRSLADALEGNGRHPLPCSDAEMPARRLMDMDPVTLPYFWDALYAGQDPIDVLCDFELCDE